MDSIWSNNFSYTILLAFRKQNGTIAVGEGDEGEGEETANAKKKIQS